MPSREIGAAPAYNIVMNSGFAFREAGYVSNSRETRKLPDYAIGDLTDGRM